MTLVPGAPDSPNDMQQNSYNPIPGPRQKQSSPEFLGRLEVANTHTKNPKLTSFTPGLLQTASSQVNITIKIKVANFILVCT